MLSSLESEDVMAVLIGSARHDENGKLAGKAGDQLQKGAGNDIKGEVSMQEYYKHKLGWNGYRFKDVANRHRCAERMVKACNNPNIGYSQTQRNQILAYDIETIKPINCDCSSLVREVIIEATEKDPGNFTTADADQKLMATGLFDKFDVKSESDLMTGDILCTKKKGHIVVVVAGKSPEEVKEDYYPMLSGYKGTSIVGALAAVGEKDTSMTHRKKIAAANGIQGYIGSAKQNLQLLDLLKNGKLKKC